MVLLWKRFILSRVLLLDKKYTFNTRGALMKKATFILLIILSYIPHVSAGSLRVDFNGNNWGEVVAETQSGFEAYNARNEVVDDFVPVGYEAFGTTITVTPTWASRADATAMQSFWRTNNGGYVENDENLFSLVRDWIGTDTRSNGDPLTLTISGLPAGTYSWISYHHDTAAVTMGKFDVTVNDDTGSNTTTGIQITGQAVTAIEGVATFTTTLVSNGIDDITLVFDQQPYTNPYNEAWFIMNGFEISDGEAELCWHAGATLRRPISPEHPMWLVHIDTWNYADPRKIIELIPEDIRPYVVMNISLSISHDEATSRFKVAEYGYEIAKSWLRACAEYRMWAVVQPSSGGYSQFSDFDLSVYEEFYRDYPNMIGFNYCEQFWGYDSHTDLLSAAWEDRITHFADLLELSDRYGGYLVVSWCGNQWSPNINPIAMLKRNPAFASACHMYTDNYILCEKYTQQSYISDMESLCLGAYLSGYSGHYGMRYDDTGWTDVDGEHDNFTMATAGAAHLEHIMLTGMTVIDGPELIWTQCFKEISAGSTTDGYTMRRWDTYTQFNNISVDLFRKILDGTVRIPSRQEVIDRTKVVILNDVDYGSSNNIYSSPETLFQGLYRMDGDGNYEYNKTFFKKTGRYPTIPTAYRLGDDLAESFMIQVNRSDYSSRWPSISAKVNEFESLFEEEYSGDIYAGRYENGWVIYNPYKTGQTANGMIDLQYNTCDSIELTLSQYTSGVVKEYADSLSIYLNNYDNVIDTGLKTDMIKIYGCSSKPEYSYVDRSSHQDSSVTRALSRGGVFTLNVHHNGPIDITLDCSGTNTNRLTSYTPSAVSAPNQPMDYRGALQYEAECFDYQNISTLVKGGYYENIRNYTGQGYLGLGTRSNARVRDIITVLKDGTYWLETRYAVTGANVNTVALYINGVRVATPTFTKTNSLSDWSVNIQSINLKAGENTIEFKANSSGKRPLYLDHILVVPTTYGDGIVVQENEPEFLGVDGTIDDLYIGFTGDGYADTNDVMGAGIDWMLNCDASGIQGFTFRYACLETGTADLIINDEIVSSKIAFTATGAWSIWDYVTVYVDLNAGDTRVRLQSTFDEGLPLIDSVEMIAKQPISQ